VKNLDCKTAEKKILQLLPEEIRADKGLVSHISSCQKCGSLYAAVYRISSAAEIKPEAVLPAGFEAGVWDKINADAKTAAQPARGLGLRWAMAAAYAAVLVIAIISVKSFHNSPAVKSVAAAPKNISVPVKAVVKKAPVSVKLALKSPVPKVTAASEPAKSMAVEAAAVVKTETVNEAPLPMQPFPHTPAQSGAVIASAPVPAAKSGAAVSALSAGKDGIKEELTKTFTDEDRLKGPVQVFNNMIHPLKRESTEIRYTIKTQCFVTAIVFDRNGKQIKKLISGNMQPGTYSIYWPGDDESGNTAATGIYVIYFKSDSAVDRIKVGVIK
jgi:hypothetical protein